MRLITVVGIGLGVAAPLGAQTDAVLLAEGREAAARSPREALRLFHEVLRHDSLHFEANWRSAVALVNIGQETPDSIRSLARDSSYLAAGQFARRAVAADSGKPEGHFVLAMALGRVALTKSKKDRVRFAIGIYQAATRALAIDPNHDGAHHILGLWHAEAMRTSGFNRFMAKNLLGGKILSKANWAAAVDHLETAVRIDPTRIFHRLDLARIYVNLERFSAARRELDQITKLPDRELLDARYRAEAVLLRQRIDGKADRGP